MKKRKITSTHGGAFGRIVFGVFEAEDGSVTAHLWKQPEWHHHHYCPYIAQLLQLIAEIDDVPIEVVWESLSTIARKWEELQPTGKAKKH